MNELDLDEVSGNVLWYLQSKEVPGQVIQEAINNLPCLVEIRVTYKGPDGQVHKQLEVPRQKMNEPLRRLFQVLLTLTLKNGKLEVEEAKRIFPKEYEKRVAEWNETILAKLREEARKEIEPEVQGLVEERLKPGLAELAGWEAAIVQREKDLEDGKKTLNNSQDKLITERNTLSDDQNKLLNEKQLLKSDRVALDKDKQEFVDAGGPELLARLKNTSHDFEQQPEAALAPAQHKPCKATLLSDLKRSFSAQDYVISDTLLMQTLLGVCVAAATGQFVVLTGPPGSGKTSLVKKLAAALDAGNATVPVRPAWIDGTDLLGFYDARQKLYQPTPFLDEVVEASRHSSANRLYFLTLDEMNLARIENYGADFLSRLEKARAGEEDATIALYSRNIQGRLVGEQNQLIRDGENELRLATLSANLGRYPAEMSIPDGLVIFGTINLDETTFMPSPKFLDRTLTVQVSNVELNSRLPKSGPSARTSSSVTWTMTTEFVRSLSDNVKLPDDADKIWKQIHGWDTAYLKPLGVHLSRRLPQVFRCYMAAASQLGLGDRLETVADTFMLSKIMPMVSFRKDETEKKGALTALLAKVDEVKYPGTHAALAKLDQSQSLMIRYLE